MKSSFQGFRKEGNYFFSYIDGSDEMADGHDFQSSDNNSISSLNNAISNGSTDINSSTKSTNERERLFQVQFEEKYAEKLDCSEGVKIQWLGGFVELQDFVSDVLDEPGKWNSPGGKAKSYRNSKITMTWYYDRKTLLFQGNSGANIKEYVRNLVKTYGDANGQVWRYCLYDKPTFRQNKFWFTDLGWAD